MSQAPRGKHDRGRERWKSGKSDFVRTSALAGTGPGAVEPEASDPGSWYALRLGISRANGGCLLAMGMLCLLEVGAEVDFPSLVSLPGGLNLVSLVHDDDSLTVSNSWDWRRARAGVPPSCWSVLRLSSSSFTALARRAGDLPD